MNEPHPPPPITQAGVMSLLSLDETVGLERIRRGARLAVGEEYLELDHLDHGVRRMRPTTPIDMACVLARRAVQESTWASICARLPPVSAAPAAVHRAREGDDPR